MIPSPHRSEGFPKTARLLKSRDFKFSRYKRYQSDWFGFTYQLGGSGRLGVSISKKVLRNATARNRVRRLLRESFRGLRGRVETGALAVDVHVVALPTLKTVWRTLGKADVSRRVEDWYGKVSPALPNFPKKVTEFANSSDSSKVQ
jgi:ribonuclease P protein component